MKHLPDYGAIETLKQYPHWTGCKYPDKTLLNPHTGGQGQSTNPGTQGTYELAFSRATIDDWTHLGFALHPKVTDIMLIDFDDCVKGERIDPEVWEMVKALNSYAEFSPSGEGIHVLCQGVLPANIGAYKPDLSDLSNPPPIPTICEMYDHGRWLTLTGHHVKGLPTTIEPRYREVIELHKEIAGRIERHKKALKALRSPVKVSANGAGSNKAYAKGAFNDEIQTLRTTAKGGRNEQLFNSACNLLEFVNAGELVKSEVESALTAAAEATGLDQAEIEKALRSAKRHIGDKKREIPEVDSTLQVNGNGHGPVEAAKEPKDAQASKPRMMTDLGNAKRLVHYFGQNLRYVKAWGKWYVWDGTRWAEDETGAVERIAKEVSKLIYREALESDEEMRPKLMKWGAASESAGKIAAMIELARTEPGISVRHTDLDNKPMLLNCLNGTIDLATGELLPHSREHNITKRIELAYDPAALCPKWLIFLEWAMAESQEMVDFLQRAIGYTLTGDISEQCLFFMFGGGDNGKTVVSETVKGVAGEYGQKAPTDMIMARYNSNIPNDVARLPGARFVVVAEVEEGRRLAESQVKDLTGGDTITARFMRQEFFEFKPTHKLWMYGNHKPKVKGTDNGIWRRIRLIPFMVKITEKEKDPQLPKKLQAELPGILAWAVRGCLEWQRIGLQVPEAVKRATESYRAEMDHLAEFIEAKCIVKPEAEVRAGELHLEYLKWCEANGEKHPLKLKSFGSALREKGYKSDDTSNYVRWMGLGLKIEGKTVEY